MYSKVLNPGWMSGTKKILIPQLMVSKENITPAIGGSGLGVNKNADVGVKTRRKHKVSTIIVQFFPAVSNDFLFNLRLTVYHGIDDPS